MSEPKTINADAHPDKPMPEWAERLSELLTELIMSRCRTSSDANRLMRMLEEFKNACSKTI